MLLKSYKIEIEHYMGVGVAIEKYLFVDGENLSNFKLIHLM